MKDDDQELNWMKKEPLLVKGDPRVDVTPHLVEDKERRLSSPGQAPWSNVSLVEGDSLDALLALRDATDTSVNVIYADLSQSDFDNRFDPTVAPDLSDTFPLESEWRKFLKPRLEAAKELLVAEGAIFFAVDEEKLAMVNALLNQVFGTENYLGSIVRPMNKSSVQVHSLIPGSKNHVLMFAREKESLLESDLIYRKPRKRNYAEFVMMRNDVVKDVYHSEEYESAIQRLLDENPRFSEMEGYYHFSSKGYYKVELVMSDEGGGLDVKYLDSESDNSLPSVIPVNLTPDNKKFEELGIQFSNPSELSFLYSIYSLFPTTATFLDMFADAGTTGHAVELLNAFPYGREGLGARHSIMISTGDKAGDTPDAAYIRLKAFRESKWAQERIQASQAPANVRLYKVVTQVP